MSAFLSHSRHLLFTYISTLTSFLSPSLSLGSSIIVFIVLLENTSLHTRNSAYLCRHTHRIVSNYKWGTENSANNALAPVFLAANDDYCLNFICKLAHQYTCSKSARCQSYSVFLWQAIMVPYIIYELLVIISF